METTTADVPATPWYDVKAPSVKQLSAKPDLLAGGHRLCAGCSEAIAVRQSLLVSPYPLVAINATGCLEVATTIFPYTAWRIPWIHNAFENAAATASGVETAYRALRKQGKIPDRDIRFVVFGGDGGTYDIGFQSLSGAFERGHRLVYICLNNEGYMNTGIQRSSATPLASQTTTSPVGEVIVGKTQWRKDLTGIMAAHDVPYVAQTAAIPNRINDLSTKVLRALEAPGPAFVNCYAACNRGWRHEPAETVHTTQLAVETCYWPLFEVIEGQWTLNYQPKEKKPIEEFLKVQGRFRHLLKPGNRSLLEAFQAKVDQEWARLLTRCGG